MAQKITVALEDDIDGGPADETVRFGLGGTEYEIDLSTKNAAAFRQRLHAAVSGVPAAPGDVSLFRSAVPASLASCPSTCSQGYQSTTMPPRWPGTRDCSAPRHRSFPTTPRPCGNSPNTGRCTSSSGRNTPATPCTHSSLMTSTARWPG